MTKMRLNFVEWEFSPAPSTAQSRRVYPRFREAGGYNKPVSLVPGGQFLIDRMVLAVERVRDRLLRSTAALEAAGIPYAVVGGNAVAAWVATVDTAAVRNTQDVDILLRREDLDVAAKALEAIGFVRRHIKGIDMFLDGADAKARDAVHVVFAGEKVKADSVESSPEITESEKPDQFRIITLESLVKMKLTSFRRKDQVHLLDMLEVGLIDASWTVRFSVQLGARLRQLIETPEG